MQQMMQDVIQAALDRGADFADLRITSGSATAVAVEDGRADKISAAQSRGAGLRVLVGGAWGFAPTNRPDAEELMRCVDDAVGLARAASSHVTDAGMVAEVEPVVGETGAQPRISPTSIPLDERVAAAVQLEAAARADHPGLIANTIAHYADGSGETFLANSFGTFLHYTATGTTIGVSVVASDGQTRQRASERVANRVGFELVEETDLEQMGREAAGRAVSLLSAERAPAGTFDVIIDPKICGLLVHEAFGHNSEADAVWAGNSILADKIALKCADYVVTEAGFGADCGAEKFLNIKCRVGNTKPSAVVIVATVKAMKLHGGAFEFKPGRKPPMEQIAKENVAAARAGCANLAKHIENMGKMGLPVVVAINIFPTDTPAEIAAVKEEALKAGARAAVETYVHGKGGAGGAELAQAVVDVCDQGNDFHFLYPLEASIKEKIETIATEIYGADGVEYSPLAESKIRQFTKQGYDKLPICMAKTHLSLSHDPDLKGRPTGFTVPVRDVKPSLGAGFLYPLCGEMRTMPGLPTRPAAVDVDLGEDGNIVGLF
ncbi:MAG TPA: hypothetical protein DGT21_13975 [Armatimonadetes bacterium]|nr:hypothetical protein [Armatimonadota bacterium]